MVEVWTRRLHVRVFSVSMIFLYFFQKAWNWRIKGHAKDVFHVLGTWIWIVVVVKYGILVILICLDVTGLFSCIFDDRNRYQVVWK